MRAFIVIALFALTCNQVSSAEIKCAQAVASCNSGNFLNNNCDKKASVLACLKKEGCAEDDNSYKTQVAVYGNCGTGTGRDPGIGMDTVRGTVTGSGTGTDSQREKKEMVNGASAIIIGWTLPILMFTVAKYFSK